MSKETFNGMVLQGKFLEWANVHDNSYGTSMEAFTAGETNLLDILPMLVRKQIME